jgi:hypothetical protein
MIATMIFIFIALVAVLVVVGIRMMKGKNIRG